MRIKAHEMINPNNLAECYDSATTADEREAIACFSSDECVWRVNIARTNGADPEKLRWHPVPNTGTDVYVCEITGINAMCDTWELR